MLVHSTTSFSRAHETGRPVLGRKGIRWLLASLAIGIAAGFAFSSKSSREPIVEDASQAAALFQKACEQGSSIACNNLGVLYQSGDGVPEDDARAARLFRRACEGSCPDGCNNLGALHQHGWGVSQDSTKALRLYERACDGGVALGCSNLGALYARGGGEAAALHPFE